MIQYRNTGWCEDGRLVEREFAVIAVEPEGQDIMNLPETEPGDGSQPSAAGQRFAYPGGSRPLDGYTIKRGVGHGGFGEVYFATSDAGKEVALKLIRRSLDIELRGIKQCINLKHPNLLSIFDIKEDGNGDNWVVMEYVAGQCLDDVIADNPQGMPVEKALAWLFGISAGVTYLHDHGIVHRDLKPGNIFSDEGRVEIGDYGLSKFISCSRRSGHTESVGTVHYMAPEVANGRYGKEIDVYALGIILYEMLTGRVPFEGESVGEVLMKHLTAKPDVSCLAQPYRSVVARALEKDPEKRFRTVPEMISHLPQPQAGAVDSLGGIPAGGNPANPGLSQLGDAAARAAFSEAPEPLNPNGAQGNKPNLMGAEAVVMAEAVEEEPVQKAAGEMLSQLRHWWNDLNTPAKVAISVVAVFAFMSSAEFVVPLGMVALIAYGGYRVVWSLTHAEKSKTQPNTAQQWTPPPAVAAAATGNGKDAGQKRDDAKRSAHAVKRAKRLARHKRRKQRRVNPREKALNALVVKPLPQRIGDLLGSMIVATLVAMTMCLVMVIVTSFRSEIPRPEQCAWLLLVSIAGAWGVMIPSKFWEGSKGEPMLRRFVLLIVGLGVGLVAWGTAELFMVDLIADPNFPKPHEFSMPDSFYNGGPRALAFLAVFGTMMALVRWWRHSDPLRATRLSLWTMFIASALAGITAWAWHFPQPWLIMVACTMSAAVQMSSPWVHPRKRFGDNDANNAG